jgi:hypothetical protein
MINYFFKRLRAVSIAFLIAFSMPSFSATTIMSSTDIYLRGNSGSIQYSLDQSNWTSIATFPVSLINSGVTDINVRFISNYSGPDIEYFETASEGLNFLYSYSGIPIKSRDGYTINLINNSITTNNNSDILNNKQNTLFTNYNSINSIYLILFVIMILTIVLLILYNADIISELLLFSYFILIILLILFINNIVKI